MVPSAHRYIGLTTLLVAEYDPAIAFFVKMLGFSLLEDSASLSSADGSPKRWVVVSPGNRGANLLLARASTPEQVARIGDQTGGRVGFFLYTDDFERDFRVFGERGVRFVREPVSAPYGRVAVFQDISGNLWDLIGPA